MIVKSVEFSKAFVGSLCSLSQSDINGILDAVSLEVLEGAVETTTSFANDDTFVGRMIAGLEDGTITTLALKRHAD